MLDLSLPVWQFSCSIEIVQVILVVLLGLTLGSFASVLTHRVPLRESIVAPGSHCPNCKAPINILDKIPIFSFLVLRGRCRNCRSAISPLYLLTEVVTMTFIVVSVWKSNSIFGALALITLAVLTMPLAIIDFRMKRLPNPLTYSGVSIGLILASIESFLEGNLLFIRQSVTFLLVASGFFFILNLISRGGMGMGDVKLAGMIGALLYQCSAFTVIAGFFVAFLFGAITGIALILSGHATRKSAIPFGPFILFGMWFGICLEPAIQNRVIELLTH